MILLLFRIILLMNFLIYDFECNFHLFVWIAYRWWTSYAFTKSHMSGHDFPTRKRRSETRLPSNARKMSLFLLFAQAHMCVCRADACCQVFNFTEEQGFLKPRGWNFIIIRNSRHVSLQLLSVGWGHFNALNLQAEQTTRHIYVIRINCKNPTT